MTHNMEILEREKNHHVRLECEARWSEQWHISVHGPHEWILDLDRPSTLDTCGIIGPISSRASSVNLRREAIQAKVMSFFYTLPGPTFPFCYSIVPFCTQYTSINLYSYSIFILEDIVVLDVLMLILKYILWVHFWWIYYLIFILWFHTQVHFFRCTNAHTQVHFNVPIFFIWYGFSIIWTLVSLDTTRVFKIATHVTKKTTLEQLQTSTIFKKNEQIILLYMITSGDYDCIGLGLVLLPWVPFSP